MTRRGSRLGAMVWCGLWALMGGVAQGDGGADASQDTVGEHLVQPGDTLRSITRRYLGTEKLWRDNWRLNPQLRDPHVLRVGQRLKVILSRELPARGAVVETVANRVDKNQQRRGWQDAAQGDGLKPRDGVRTLSQSSAGLRFDDDTKLTLSEYSQVFLKDISTSLAGVKQGSIEVERGQVDLVLIAPRPDLSEIEIIVGATVSRPRSGGDGKGETRARMPPEGGSQLMVYSGSSRVEAGGQAVEVARGMGTSVPEGGTPSPPERLLPRPALRQPGNEEKFDYSNPTFAWRPVRGASSYTLEVCRDATCDQLVARATEIVALEWSAPELPIGELFFRLTAVSASGLDGYPSATRRFHIERARPDLEPPWVVVTRVGGGFFRAIRGTTVLVLSVDARLRLHAHDDASGTEQVSFRWDDGEWQIWQGEDLQPPAGAGEHQLEVLASDRLGHQGAPWTTLVEVDGGAPGEARAGRQPGR